jgi:predicted nucleic-acid-binding protein
MVLLDTDILIPYLRNDPSIKKKISELLDRNILLSTTSINVAERVIMIEQSRNNYHYYYLYL